MRALGIDFGEKRIGLAISDDEGRLAVPVTTVARDTDRRALYRLADLVRERGVTHLVIGEPRLLDGRLAENAARIRRFGERLARITGLPLRRVEETLTTVEAGERLARAGVTLTDQDGRRDAVAAQILLQEALDQGL